MSPKAIYITLQKLLTRLEAYNHVYKEAIERIKGQVAGYKDLAKKTLSQIIYTKRLLSTLEIQHALIVEVGKPKLNKENALDTKDIVSMYTRLVTINKENKIIRLVYYITHEYLLLYKILKYTSIILYITNKYKVDI